MVSLMLLPRVFDCSVHVCARICAPSLARVLNYWILAPLHILPYTHSSLQIHRYKLFRVRSHRCALARSGSELLGPSSVTHSALYTFIVTQCIVYGYKRCALAGKPKFPRLVGIWGGILSRRSPNWSQAGDSNIPATRKHSCDLETRNMMTGRGEGNAPRSRTYVGALWNETQMLSIQLFERN